MNNSQYYVDTICDNIMEFDSGYSVFNDYLRNSMDSAVIHYICDKETDRLVAYFSLVASGILLGDPNNLNAIPAIEIKMFALDKRCQGSGLASCFLDVAVDMIKFIACEYVGAEAIILYSVPVERVVKLYESKGFERIGGVLTAFKSDFTNGCIPMFMEI